jgi:predicted dehydrogenase
MIQAGELGEIRQWRAVYLQDWIVDPAAPRAWRMDRSRAGSGAHGDINAHIIDLARMLVGEIDTVCGAMETFIKRRPLPDGSGRTGRVTVDDATAFLARFQNGVLGTFEATRMATGHRNDLRFEVNGSRGSVSFAVERLNELRYYAGDDPPGRRGFRTISVTDSEHPYGDRWWPPGHVLGWEHSFVHTVHELLQAIAQDRTPSPNFLDGARDQAVLDAVTESAQARAWVRVPRVTAPRRTGGRT